MRHHLDGTRRSRGGRVRADPSGSSDLSDFTRGAASEGNLGYLCHRCFSDEREDRQQNTVAMIRDYALPSLRRVLESVPEHISLMVEIKYPMPEFCAETSLPYPERNLLVDRTMEVIFGKGSRQRRILFLSFDPDICLMARKKQSVYPVCFLNAAGRSVASENRDPRALTVVNGVAFAVWAGLDGMVLLSDLIFEEPSVVQIIHSTGLKVYCYGRHTTEPGLCRQLIEWGVDGLIADKVGFIARALNPTFDKQEETNASRSSNATETVIFHEDPQDAATESIQRRLGSLAHGKEH